MGYVSTYQQSVKEGRSRLAKFECPPPAGRVRLAPFHTDEDLLVKPTFQTGRAIVHVDYRPNSKVVAAYAVSDAECGGRLATFLVAGPGKAQAQAKRVAIEVAHEAASLFGPAESGDLAAVLALKRLHEKGR